MHIGRLIGLSGALLLAVPAWAQEGPCPARLAGAFSTSPAYRFAFQSWLWRSGAEFRFGNCVRNTGRRGMFIDWRGTSLVGYVPPGQTIYSVVPSATARGFRRLSPLFYGGRPNRTDVQTVMPVAALFDQEQPLIQTAVWQGEPYRWTLLSQPSSPTGFGPAVISTSVGRLYVPKHEVLAALADGSLTRDRLVDYIEEHPEVLQPFFMEFTDTRSVAADGRITITYHCDYVSRDVAGVDDEDPFRVRFADAAFHRTMFSTEEAFGLGDWWRSSASEFSASVAVSPGGRIRRVTTRLDIFLADGVTLIGSMPIEYSAAT